MKSMRGTSRCAREEKGFTLIELLVVIAVIGILAAVVLASLGSARNKGKDKAIISDLANARTQVQLYFSTNGSVSMGLSGAYGPTLCFAPTNTNTNTAFSDPKTKEILAHAAIQNGSTIPIGATSLIPNSHCYGFGTNWSMAIKLNEGNGAYAWCVDSSGISKKNPIVSSMVGSTSVINPTTYLCN